MGGEDAGLGFPSCQEEAWPSLPALGGGWGTYGMEPGRSTEQTWAHTRLYSAAVPCCPPPRLSLPAVKKAFSAPTACDPC